MIIIVQAFVPASEWSRPRTRRSPCRLDVCVCDVKKRAAPSARPSRARFVGDNNDFSFYNGRVRLARYSCLVTRFIFMYTVVLCVAQKMGIYSSDAQSLSFRANMKSLYLQAARDAKVLHKSLRNCRAALIKRRNISSSRERKRERERVRGIK